MSSLTLLAAAARAFALTSLSDGELDPSEEYRFASFVASEAAIQRVSRSEIAAAWALAVKEVEAGPDFAASLAAIRTEATREADKQLVMRGAQSAAIADEKLELQEDRAVRAIAEALGLDPEAY